MTKDSNLNTKETDSNRTIIIQTGDVTLAYCTVIIISILSILILMKK